MYVTDTPITRKKIRYLVEKLRSNIIAKDLFVDVVMLLEVLPNKFKHLDIEICDDKEMEKEYFGKFIPSCARTNNRPLIKIKESVYDNACDPNSPSYGRDRMTIAHEIGHFILIDLLETNVTPFHGSGKPKLARTVEWQAKAFAGELLMPFYETKDIKDVRELAKKCGVSIEAANYRINKYMKE